MCGHSVIMPFSCCLVKTALGYTTFCIFTRLGLIISNPCHLKKMNIPKKSAKKSAFCARTHHLFWVALTLRSFCQKRTALTLRSRKKERRSERRSKEWRSLMLCLYALIALQFMFSSWFEARFTFSIFFNTKWHFKIVL